MRAIVVQITWGLGRFVVDTSRISVPCDRDREMKKVKSGVRDKPDEFVVWVEDVDLLKSTSSSVQIQVLRVYACNKFCWT